jgi:hypothetical protein
MMPVEILSGKSELVPADENPFWLRTEEERQRELAEIVAAAQARLRQAQQNPPEWLSDLHPATPSEDGSNGLHRLVGSWPGEETDEEIAAALERLS